MSLARRKSVKMRKKNTLYQNNQPFKLSRSKIELFNECPCCFYLDRKLGISQPPGLPFNLNSAVDTLLKKEFDSYREKGMPHPLMIEKSIKAIPFQHEQLDDWRNNRRGVIYLHEPTQFIVTGSLDDIWINQEGELIVVDYKATSKKEEVSIDADWQVSYKNQMEIYQWLLRRNGFKVSNTGYFIYCNGKKDVEAFNGRLEFDISVISYEGSDEWIEPKLREIHDCLLLDEIPSPAPTCKLCEYRLAVSQILDSSAD